MFWSIRTMLRPVMCTSSSPTIILKSRNCSLMFIPMVALSFWLANDVDLLADDDMLLRVKFIVVLAVGAVDTRQGNLAAGFLDCVDAVDAVSESSESEFHELEESSNSMAVRDRSRRLLQLLLLRLPVRCSIFSFHSAVGGRRLKRNTGWLGLSWLSSEARGAAALHTMAEKAICRKDLRRGRSPLRTKHDLMADTIGPAVERGASFMIGVFPRAVKPSGCNEGSSWSWSVCSVDDCWLGVLIGRTTATFLWWNLLDMPELLIVPIPMPEAQALCWTVTIGLILSIWPVAVLPGKRWDDQFSASILNPEEMTFWSSRTSDGIELTAYST